MFVPKEDFQKLVSWHFLEFYNTTTIYKILIPWIFIHYKLDVFLPGFFMITEGGFLWDFSFNDYIQ